MLTDLLAPLAHKILLGLVVALGLLFWAWRAEVSSHNDTRDDLALSEARHAVTRASLGALADRLEGMVADGELRAERLEQARADVAADVAPLREQADRLESGEIDYREVEGL